MVEIVCVCKWFLTLADERREKVKGEIIESTV